jgi:hypothetical protein
LGDLIALSGSEESDSEMLASGDDSEFEADAKQLQPKQLKAEVIPEKKEKKGKKRD